MYSTTLRLSHVPKPKRKTGSEMWLKGFAYMRLGFNPGTLIILIRCLPNTKDSGWEQENSVLLLTKTRVLHCAMLEARFAQEAEGILLKLNGFSCPLVSWSSFLCPKFSYLPEIETLEHPSSFFLRMNSKHSEIDHSHPLSNVVWPAMSWLTYSRIWKCPISTIQTACVCIKCVNICHI